MDVIMPQLGETVREGTVSRWNKRVGEPVTTEDPLFEVDTDKVTTEVPAPVNGILLEILVEEGATVAVGTRLAVVGEKGAAQAAAPVGAHPAPPRADGAASARPAFRETARPRGEGRLSPVVRRLLAEHGLAPAELSGTGRDGRITRGDVLTHLAREPAPASAVPAPSIVVEAPVRGASASPPLPPRMAAPPLAPAPAPSAGADDYTVPLSKIRRKVAAHMVLSKATSPHALQAVEVDFHGVEQARQAFGARFKETEATSLTYLPFIAKAVCEAIASFPYVNSSFGEDELIVHRRIHLGIAVDLNFDGLVVTTVRDAHHRNLRGLAVEIARLAKAARAGKASQDELSGATYAISNSGSFGTLFSASIINQPQTAILSTDGVRKRPVVVERPEGDFIAIRPVGILAQSFDHRAFDGAYSAAFLRTLKDAIEQRDWMAELA